MTYDEEQTAIGKAMAQLPDAFGLRGFPGKTFRVSRLASYVNGDAVVMLYTQIRDGDRWLDFAKGTASELRREVTSAT